MNFFRIRFNIEYPVALISSFLLLVPFGRLSNIPMMIMCFMGIRLLFFRKINFHQKEYRLFSFVFLCFFVPILCSLPDAVNRGSVVSVAGFYGSYFFSGIYVINTLSRDIVRQRSLLKICSCLLIFCVSDALIQSLLGWDLLGFEVSSPFLNGIFGTKTPKLGIYLAALFPFCLVYSCRYYHWLVWFFLLIGTSAVVFMSGRRTGWVILFVIILLFIFWQIFGEKRISIKYLIVGSILAVFSLFALYVFSPDVNSRVDRSLLVFSDNSEAVDLGTGKRLPIWTTALQMIKSHPLNGVGARNFRYAYINFADKDDTFVDKKASLGAYQAHQLLLDVTANTGLIGLVGLGASFWLMFFAWRTATFPEKMQKIPYALMLIGVFFPLNSHFATYSSQWSSMLFWLISLYFAHSCEENHTRETL